MQKPQATPTIYPGPHSLNKHPRRAHHVPSAGLATGHKKTGLLELILGGGG